MNGIMNNMLEVMRLETDSLDVCYCDVEGW